MYGQLGSTEWAEEFQQQLKKNAVVYLDLDSAGGGSYFTAAGVPSLDALLRYIGWYDGNPANLHALPPEQAAKKYIEYMGSAQAVIARARQAFKDGDYRWVAQIMNHVVFAEPANREAKELAADALEQLGYREQIAPGRWADV